jgi:hypothetical protein
MKPKSKPTWDIYQQQPLWLKIIDPAMNLQFTVAAVSKKPKGIVWWNLDYIVSIQKGSGLGSGFCESPIDLKPVFDFEREIWVIQRGERTYEFHLPDRELLRFFDKNKQYVSSLEEFQQDAKNSYGGK